MTTIACKNHAQPMTRFYPSPAARASGLFALALLAAVALGPVPAHAERADRDKPMHIEADNLRHDELQQTSVFSGNVVLTKGSIVLRGAQLVVRQDAQGYQYGVVTADSGGSRLARSPRISRALPASTNAMPS